MATPLSVLPDELLLCILDLLWLPELLEIACCCQRFHALSARRLRTHVDFARVFGSWRRRHQTTPEEYIASNMLDASHRGRPEISSNDVTWRHLFWSFYWILTTDAAPEHVYRLPLVAPSTHSRDDTFGAIYTPPNKASTFYHLANTLATLGQPEDEAQRVQLLHLLNEHILYALEPIIDSYPTYAKRARESLALLMLLVCRNVHTLDVIPTDTDLRHMRCTIGKPLLDICMNISPHSQLLRNLHTIHWHELPSASNNLNTIIPFMCLPSVRHIVMHRCIHSLDTDLIWPTERPQQNWPWNTVSHGQPKPLKLYVTTLQFHDSFVSRGAIAALAEHMANDCIVRIDWEATPLPKNPSVFKPDEWAVGGRYEEAEWCECRIEIQRFQYDVERRVGGKLVVEKVEGMQPRSIEFLDDEFGSPLRALWDEVDIN